jgi:hypothetical protein
MPKVISVCDRNLPMLVMSPELPIRNGILPVEAIYHGTNTAGELVPVRQCVAQRIHAENRHNRVTCETRFADIDHIRRYVLESFERARRA